MIITTPEVLLSIVILSLVLYGLNFPTFKVSIGALLIIGIVVSFNGLSSFYDPLEINLWLKSADLAKEIGGVAEGNSLGLTQLAPHHGVFPANVEESAARVVYWTGGLLMANSWIIVSKIIIIIGSISILLLSTRGLTPLNNLRLGCRITQGNLWLKKRFNLLRLPRVSTYRGLNSEGIPQGNFFETWSEGFISSPILVLIVALSSLLLVSSINWLSIYLAIELQTLTLFILAALKRDSGYGTEAGLKYFVLGAVSSGIFLFGCALLYGLTGESSIQGINSILSADVGKILITISLLFKLSAAPFHMWAPDVYDGAPTTITALLAIVPKVGVFSILIQIGPITNVLLLCAVFSIIYGAIGALNQTKIKRLLAYSGIGHMGFILFGVAIGSFESIQASLIYLIIYVIMSICSFSIILSLKLTKDLIIEVSGLSRENPVMALTLALTFLSTAGVPPLAGFLSKWLILLSGISNGYYLICVVGVVSAVIAGVYYVRLVQMIYFQGHYSILIWILKKEERVDLSNSFLIGLSFFLILFLMVCPNFLLQITHDATISLYM